MLDKRKMIRVGIDRITLYNFEIIKSPPTSTTSTDVYVEEYVRVKDELFSLDSTTRLYSDNRLTEYKSLSFNPNRILSGHNIHNANSEDIRESIKRLKQILSNKGIEIDLKNAKIDEIEVNFNFDISFIENVEVFTALFIKQKKFKKIADGSKNTRYRNIFRDETISSNLNTSRVQIYDKTREVNNSELLSEELTRLEWWFHRSTYSYFAKTEYELDNSFETLLNNFHVIEQLFLRKTKKELLEKGFNFLNKELKPTLEREYLAFKSANKFARNRGKKQKRDVYKHLEKEYWIFDSLYLVDIVKEHDKKNYSREKKRILKKYSQHKGIEKLENFVSFLFPH